MVERLARFGRWMAVSWRRDWLTLKAVWHGVIADDWTDSEFETAITELRAAGKEARHG